MQFAPDFEMCIRNPMKIKTLKEPRKSEVIAFLHQFRLSWHQCRVYFGEYPESKKWLKRRGYEN